MADVGRLTNPYGQGFNYSEVLGRLRSEFSSSHGPLFHYTDHAASTGLRNGQLWMTRADCFLDATEIAYGLDLFRVSARTDLDERERALFNEVLAILRARLQSCFFWSLSQDPDSEHLRHKYATDGEPPLRFSPGFPITLRAAWHIRPADGLPHKVHFVVDHYDFFEGFVVYDDARQRRLAAMACQAFQDFLRADAHGVDRFLFVQVLMECLVLFKSRRFEPEGEHRIALVHKPDSAESFEETRDSRGRRFVYITVGFPKSSGPDRQRA